ncbi:hypothetical protein CYMTET_36525, partial [Cymbomonas tetramitiformis]
QQAARWQPDWGAPIPYAIGHSVLYRRPDGSVALAKIEAVDNSIDPPAYTIEVDGAIRDTERTHIAPPPKPPAADSPPPGPPPNMPAMTPSAGQDSASASSASFPLAPPPPSMPQSDPPQIDEFAPVPPFPPTPTPPAASQYLHNVAEAQKFAKYAASSLQFDDVPSGVHYLRQALAILTGTPQ